MDSHFTAKAAITLYRQVLAWAAANQPEGDRQNDCRNHDKERLESPRRD